MLGLVDDAEVLEGLLELVDVGEAVHGLVAGGVRAVRPPEILRRLGAAHSNLKEVLKILSSDTYRETHFIDENLQLSCILNVQSTCLGSRKLQ